MINEKKDACYSKVKSRYSVWPSAYASGALVKCRKVGAANWGNKSKKKNESILNTYANMAFMIAELSLATTTSYIKKAHKQDVEGKKDRSKGLAKAYKKGEQKEADQGRVAEMRELSPADQRIKLDKARVSAYKKAHKGEGRRSKSEIMRASTKRLNQINARQRAREAEVSEAKKGTMPKKFSVKSGDKSAAGGLTAKGVARYRAANPGSKLKTAVTTKPSKLKKGSKAASRRKSFCARMGGMKKRLTSAKTANDPDSRINKALRKWNC